MYNKYLKDGIDKITFVTIIIYGLLLMMRMIVREDTFEKIIVNRILDDLGGFISWTIGLVPAIRCYKIVIKDNVIESITPKNYEERALEVIKFYGVLVFTFLGVLTMHKLIIPIQSGGINDVNNIVYSFQGNLANVSFFIMVGLLSIISISNNNQKKVNKIFILAVACSMPFINGYTMGWIYTSVGFEVHSGIYKLTNITAISINVILSFIFIGIILNKIYKVDAKKII